MEKRVKIFGNSVETKQLILVIILLVILIGGGIYIIRFLFPDQPKATKAAVPQTQQEQPSDTTILNDEEFKGLEDQDVNLDTSKKGRQNPFLPTSTTEEVETGGDIESESNE